MAKQKKKSKGPEHRNSNYILKNGKTNKASKKETEAGKPLEIKNEGKKGFFAGFSDSITNASNSITKIFKQGQ